MSFLPSVSGWLPLLIGRRAVGLADELWHARLVVGGQAKESQTLNPIVATLALAAFTAFVGYFLGIAKDRSNVIHAKKMEAMTKLHDHVLEIEKIELSESGASTGLVPINRGRTSGEILLSGKEWSYLANQISWREKLYEEERKARLWLSRKTVDLVGTYFLLMMTCKSWEKLGTGNLLDNTNFLEYTDIIFENSQTILEDEKLVVNTDKGQQSHFLNCSYLSDKCLEVIQKRMNLELTLFPRLQAYFQRWLPFNF